MNEKTKNHIYVILIVLAAALISIGYSVFAQPLAYKLDIQSNNNNDGNGKWKIHFTDVKLANKSGNAVEKEKPGIEDTTGTFYVLMKTPGDQMDYDFTIKNDGNLDAKVSSIHIVTEASKKIPIEFSVVGVAEGDELKVGQEIKAKVVIKYASQVPVPSAIKRAQIIINFVQK